MRSRRCAAPITPPCPTSSRALATCLPRVVARVLDERGHVGRGVAEALARDVQEVTDRHEALLRAVVERASDAAALLLRRLHDPHERLLPARALDLGARAGGED